MDLYSLAIAFCAASAISTITSKSEIPMVPAPAPEYTQKNEQKKIITLPRRIISPTFSEGMRTDGQSICENRFIYAPRLRVVSECLTNSLPGHRKSTKNIQNVGTKDQRDGRINQRAKRDEKILSYSSSYQVYTHRVYTGREGPKRSIQRLSSSRCAFHANQLRFRHR